MYNTFHEAFTEMSLNSSLSSGCHQKLNISLGFSEMGFLIVMVLKLQLERKCLANEEVLGELLAFDSSAV